MVAKFYITTAIAYPNGEPHIGYAFELLLADVLARYHRQTGDEVYFLTGTDDHGQTNVRAAEQAGVPIEEFLGKTTQRFRDLTVALNISNDDFIRTSDRVRHYPTAQEIWRRLIASGDIYKKSYQGLYCVGHEAFVTEKDLVDGKCPEHDSIPELIEEENYFFKFGRHLAAVAQLIEQDQLVILPPERKREVLSLLDEGVEDVSFSRPTSRLNWGVPVPDDPEHVMYVWCDALVNYLSTFAEGGHSITETAGFLQWWPADIHVIGKGISRFHALVWPAMLLSAKIALPKQILVHGYLTVDGKKMSKTIGNVIDPFEAQAQFGTDALRYYLLREIPTLQDGDFSWQRFAERYTSDLANDLGNLVQRSLTLLAKHAVNIDPAKPLAQLELVEGRIAKHMQSGQLHLALEEIMNTVADTNRYIDTRKPWEDRPDRTETLQHLGLILLFLERSLTPFLPETAQKMRAQIQALAPEPLFPKPAA